MGHLPESNGSFSGVKLVVRWIISTHHSTHFPGGTHFPPIFHMGGSNGSYFHPFSRNQMDHFPEINGPFFRRHMDHFPGADHFSGSFSAETYNMTRAGVSGATRRYPAKYGLRINPGTNGTPHARWAGTHMHSRRRAPCFTG